MAHEHDVQDSDKRFVIDPATRTIKNESGKIVLIQGDHNSERFTFEISRYVDGHDMAKCDTVKIHYLNANEPGVYEVMDLRVDPNDDELVIFTWLISGNATMVSGPLNFAVKFACVNNGITEYAWGTGVYSGITIGVSLDNSEVIVQEYADILEKWKSEILADLDTRIETAVDARVGTTIDAANEAAVSAQTQAALAAEAAISAKAYTNVLKGEQSGEVVHVEDAFPVDILETTVYGQSEQIITTGKNLLSSGANGVYTSSGFTVTKTDGLFNISGISTVSASAAINFFGEATILSQLIEAGETYTFSKSDVQNWSNELYIQINYKGTDDLEYVLFYLKGSDSVTVTVPDTFAKINSIFIGWEYTKSPKNINCSFRLQVEEGETATEWEPYSGGFASPSPDWPQDISSIAEVDLVTTGKNLFDPSHLIDGTGWTLVDGVYSGYASYQHDKYGVEGYPFSYTFEENTQYTLSFNGRSDNTNSNSGLVIRVRYTDGTISPYFKVTASDTMVKHVFTTAVDKTVAKISITYDYSKKSYLSDIQLEMGAEATEYVEYKGSSTTIDLAGNKLRSLPNGIRDELIVDAAGNYGIVKRIGFDTITTINSVLTLSNGLPYIIANTNMFESKNAFQEAGGSARVLCDRYPYTDPNVGTKLSRYCYRTWNAVIIVDDRFTSVEEAKAILAEEQPYVECLAPVEYIPIGTLDTPLALPENTSNVWAVTNLGTTVRVKYVQDINIVINNLIGGIQNG